MDAALLTVRRLLAKAGAGHVLAFNDPFHNLRNKYIDGLSRDALGIVLLRDEDLLHRIVDHLLDSAFLMRSSV